MTDRETMLQRLRDVHGFPGDYVFKVIGANTEDFPPRVIQAVVLALGPDADVNVSLRESSKGRHVSVTLTVTVPSAEAVMAAYDLLGVVDGVSYLL